MSFDINTPGINVRAKELVGTMIIPLQDDGQVNPANKFLSICNANFVNITKDVGEIAGIETPCFTAAAETYLKGHLGTIEVCDTFNTKLYELMEGLEVVTTDKDQPTDFSHGALGAPSGCDSVNKNYFAMVMLLAVSCPKSTAPHPDYKFATITAPRVEATLQGDEPVFGMYSKANRDADPGTKTYNLILHENPRFVHLVDGLDDRIGETGAAEVWGTKQYVVSLYDFDSVSAAQLDAYVQTTCSCGACTGESGVLDWDDVTDGAAPAPVPAPAPAPVP